MPEALVAALDELTVAWRTAMADESFRADFDTILREYAGVPSLLYDAARLTDKIGGARILLKREDLNHTGAHKVRNVLGQALLTKRMGKHRVIAETGAGQHGVASATAAAYFGLDCTVYMGSVDVKRQALNVARMELLGAKVIPVDSGSATLKDAINEALRDWVASVEHTAYLFGTAAGPHPFPSMVRDFTRGIGDEARAQCLEQFGRLPDAVAACVGGGSNAIGLFTAFLDDPEVAIYGFEAGGDGIETGRHAATHRGGRERRPARCPHLRAAGRGRPDHRVALHLGRARLPGCGATARPPRQVGPRRVPPDHRRAGHGRARAAGPHRGHHRGESSRRTRWPAPSTSPVSSARKAWCWSTSRVAATRTWRPRSPGSTCARAAATRGPGRECSSGLREGPRRRPQRPGRLPARRVPRRRRRHRRAPHHWSRRAATSSRSACPTPTPSWTGPPSRPPRSARCEGGVRTTDVLRTVEAVAATGTPVVVMTYWNPVERYGVARFAADLAAAGGSGLITPDLTPDFAPEWIGAADQHDLDKIFLVAPSSTDERIAMTTAACRGFVYATAVMGVTGARSSHQRPRRAARTPHARRVTDLPVGVGLGVSNGDQAAEVASYADGVIVGSAFVRALLDHPDDRAAGLRALATPDRRPRGGRQACVEAWPPGCCRSSCPSPSCSARAEEATRSSPARC